MKVKICELTGGTPDWANEPVMKAAHDEAVAAADALTAFASQADSVLEDAARLDFLIEQQASVVSDPDACPGYWLHFLDKETGKCWAQIDEHPTPRAAIDAARKQARSKP
jgi:hypothetical protein